MSLCRLVVLDQFARHDLANFKQHLKASEAKVAEESGALECKKHDDEVCSGIETTHPG